MVLDNSVLLAEIGYLQLGIVGVAFILLIVFCVLAAKAWHWVNIVFLILCFLSGVGAIWGLTTVYKLRTTALQEEKKWTSEAERLTEELEVQRIGQLSSPTFDEGSLRHITGLIARETYGRGRVWVGGKVTAGEDNLRTFTFSQPQQAGNEFQTLQDVILFAFLEQTRPIRGEQTLVAASYIGTVRVTQETPEALTLEPVALANANQFSQPNGTWRLFEKMPLYRNGTFKEAIISQAKDPGVDSQIAEFAKTLEGESSDLDIFKYRQLLETWLPAEKFQLDRDSREYESLIDRFAFDGLSIGKIENWIDAQTNRKAVTFSPPNEELFYKYRFNKPSSQPYQVDANGSIETDGLFDPLGNAIDEALKAGGDGVQFQAGDTVLVDAITAKQGYRRGDQQIEAFEKKEDVTEIDRVYVRQLTDYPFEFEDIRIQAQQIDVEIARVTRNNQVKQAAIQDGLEQEAERQRLITALTEDSMNLKNDSIAINEFLEQITAHRDNLNAKIALLESNIEQSYKELRKVALMISRRAFASR